MKVKSCFVLAAILSMCLILAGCPSTIIKQDEIESGEFYKNLIVSYFQGYMIDFLTNHLPTVEFDYQSEGGVQKTVRFQMDGYDSVNEIGFKLVTRADESEWENSTDATAPDLIDVDIIAEKALQYQFPVMFLYTEENIWEDNESALFVDQCINPMLETEVMRSWLKSLLYDGSLIRKGLEENYFEMYNLHFSHDDLPEIEIMYGTQTASFTPDGYDDSKEIGYKFVSVQDEDTWEYQRQNGVLNTPDLSEYELMKDSAWSQEKVLLIYLFNYWEFGIKDIYVSEMADILYDWYNN